MSRDQQLKRSFLEGALFWVLLVVALLNVSALVYMYHGSIAGDALIQLVFMEHGAAGAWFEFNEGYPIPASSSPAWTILGAGAWKAGGSIGALIFVKLVPLIAWVATAALVYILVCEFTDRKSVATVAAAVTAAMPGSLYNALFGMENILFAAYVLAVGLAMLRLIQSEGRGPLAWAVLGLFVGAGAHLRPESVMVIVALVVAAETTLRPHELSDLKARGISFVVAASLAGLALAGFHYWETGHLVPSSGISRMMRARADSLSVPVAEDIYVYGSALARLIFYLPATLGLFLWPFVESGERDQKFIQHFFFYSAVFGVFLYTSVTGAAHTARYLSWIFPLLIILSAVSFDQMLKAHSNVTKNLVVALGLAWLTVAMSAETVLRIQRLAPGANVAKVHAAVGSREDHTSELLDVICSGGCCEGDRRPEVAHVEVQTRLFLDNRVEVVSLDGVVYGPGNRELGYHSDGCPMLKERVQSTDSLVGIYSTGSVASLARRCPANFLSSVADSESERASQLPGWAWSEEQHLLIRQCE